MAGLDALRRLSRTDDFASWVARGFRGHALGPFSVAIIQDGEFVVLRDPDGAAEIAFGCLQDMMIGALFCALEREGALALSDPLAKHLPGIEIDQCGARPIQLAHLLSHSTGLWIAAPREGLPGPGGPREFNRLLRDARQRIEPGQLAVHSLTDRVILLQVAERVLGRPVYDELLDRFGRAGSTLVLRRPEGELPGCYLGMFGTLQDIAGFLDTADAVHWLHTVAKGTIARPIVRSDRVNDFVPVADGLGLYRQANGLLGQDGDHVRLGFSGIRLSADGRTAVLGHFRSSPERDHVLSRLICHLTETAMPQATDRLGHLGGFDPATLTGTYRGTWSLRLFAEVADGQLRLAGAREMGAVPAKIEPDGSLTGRWAAPNLWIEPQDVGDDTLIGLRFGKHLYIKDRDDNRLLEN